MAASIDRALAHVWILVQLLETRVLFLQRSVPELVREREDGWLADDLRAADLARIPEQLALVHVVADIGAENLELGTIMFFQESEADGLVYLLFPCYFISPDPSNNKRKNTSFS